MNRRSLLMDGLAKLAARFPACISIYQWHRKPLKIGIHHDMLVALGDNSELSPSELSTLLRIYTGNFGYLASCTKVGTPRIGIDGTPAGMVTEDEAAHALQRLEARKAKRKRQAACQKAPKSAEPEPHQPQLSGIAVLKAAWGKRQASL